tara:strand:+ start:6 stop:1997 length:1992 start_codon:yes stop_codon:yes gene_type:complete
MNSDNEEKTKVGLVQINNSFSGQEYLPLSVGYLHSYAQEHADNFDDFEFLNPIYRRMSVDETEERLSGAGLVGFSTYVWNSEISLAIARRLKERDPSTTILFGGCQIPDTREKGLETFLRENPFVDIASIGEGEVPFTRVLENYSKSDWQNVPSVAFLDSNGEFSETPPTLRVRDLNEIPSPYLTGFFDSIMEENPDQEWIGLFETNRGCPFKCSFCDWGSVAKNKMADFNLEGRLFDEIDWFSKNKIEFVYCADANFGMFVGDKFGNRDLRIAERFAENKSRTGYPHRFSVQNTKNSTEASYKVQTILNESGLDKGVLMAFQSLHKPTLAASKRGNIKLETFFELQRKFTEDGIQTFSDLILGLPLETYETYTQGISTLIRLGQHNGIQMNNLSILPNASMIEDIDKYGLETVEAPIINIHGQLEEWVDNIHEKQRLVIATDTMPRGDWRKARSFSYMSQFLHFGKLLQVPDVILNTQYSVGYNEIFDEFLAQDSEDRPIISEINSIFSDHTKQMQEGGYEYIFSPERLKVWWPPNEYALIKLMAEGKIDEFYDEAEQVMGDLLERKGVKDYSLVLHNAISLNKELMKRPYQTEDAVVETDYNIWDVYRAGLVSEEQRLKNGEGYRHTVDRTSEKWNSLDDWCREVVWWGHKKGDYIYSAIS